MIAYTSQYVDDNNKSYEVADADSKRKPYRNYISQTLDIMKPQKELMRIYPVFHFVPGDVTGAAEQRRDGFSHVLLTTPANQKVHTMLDEAFAAEPARLLYRIGIATHAFVDTWAHQNFAGWTNELNNIPLMPAPNVGHADAGYQPDRVGGVWTDPRLRESRVDNNARFLAAAESLLAKYRDYHVRKGTYDGRTPPAWKGLGGKLKESMGLPGGKHRRIEAYRAYAKWLPAYDRGRWRKAATRPRAQLLSETFGLLEWKPGVARHGTHWFQFQQAVKDHERFSLGLLQPIYRRLGLDIRVA